MNDLTINTDIVRKKLSGFISSEMSRTGFKRAVIGVSGGIDSALACFLAAEALGAENVLAVRLPYKTSSPDSLEHAQEIIKTTGVQSLTIPISEIADTLINQFPEMDAMRRGNIMARVRMIILYDQSAAFNGLVVGTGNKTELLLGYTTLYGDSACALNPIGCLYKTQVRQLSRAIGIPQTIINKPPSADLWSGQTDEGELGYTYEEVDRLLCLLVDQSYPPAKCIEAGFQSSFVEAVVTRIQRNRFKRELPPTSKLDNSGV
jgi:NAD+ synthase